MYEECYYKMRINDSHETDKEENEPVTSKHLLEVCIPQAQR